MIDLWGRILFFINERWRVIIVVCQVDSPKDRAELDIDLPVDIDLHYVTRKKRWSSTEEPLTVSSVQKLVENYRPKIVWCEYAHFATIVSELDLKGGKAWFRPHNFEVAHAYEKAIEHRPWNKWCGFSAILNTLSWSKDLIRRLSRIFAVERRMYHIADRLFFISYGDMRTMSRLYWKSVNKDWVIPFLERDHISINKNKSPLDVIYLGSTYTNNINMAGALKLLHEIIPAVEAELPGVFRFNIVGKNSSELLGNYSSKTVIIHDYIEDLSTFLQDIDIACLPVNLGWGCKIKMIEMLTSGIPVIGAPQTFRGIPPKKEAYCACKTIAEYVEAFRKLYTPHSRERIGQAGRLAYITWFNEGQRILHDALKSNERSL